MSKNVDINLVSQLAAFGLSEKESAVYIDLLRGGEVSAVTLGRNLELHRQFIYNALASLKDKGLVLQIGEKRAKWQAQNPRKLIALAEEQQARAVQISEQLLALMQYKTGQEFEVTEGVAAFRARLIDSLRKAPHDSTILMICGQWATYFEHAGEKAHGEWDRVRIAKNMHFCIIGPKSLSVAMKKEVGTRALTEYRIFTGLEESLVNTVIFEDHIDFEIYGEPHLTFSIKNLEVARSQKLFFEALWHKSEEL